MGYLQEVDRWLDELLPSVENAADVKKAIKEKILESYRNGQLVSELFEQHTRTLSQSRMPRSTSS